MCQNAHFGFTLEGASEWLSNMKIISCVRFELDFRGQIFTRRRSITVAMCLMREEIWTEKIFKNDAGYCLRITKMLGAEDEGAGSVLKYMTKPESDSNEADGLL